MEVVHSFQRLAVVLPVRVALLHIALVNLVVDKRVQLPLAHRVLRLRLRYLDLLVLLS